MIPEQVLDWSAFRAALRQQRTKVHDLTLEELVGALGGISRTTLSRIEGGGIATANTLFWLSPWLDATPEQFYLPDVHQALAGDRPPIPLTRLVRHAKEAVRAALTTTAQAGGLHGDLISRLASVAAQATGQVILMPPKEVFAPDLLMTLSPKQIIDWPAFGQALRPSEAAEGTAPPRLTIEDMAAEIGAISPSSLSRLAHGGIATADTLFRLCLWLGVSPDQFYRSSILLTLPTPARLAVFERLAERTEQAVQTAMTKAVARRELHGALGDRLIAEAAHAARRALLAPPAAVFPPAS